MIRRHLLVAWLLVLPAASRATTCPCDCNDNDTVAINELITAVDVALGGVPLSECPSFPDCEEHPCVLIASLLQCVDAALSGCPPPAGTFTNTPTATRTVTATASATVTRTPIVLEATPTLVPGSATLPALLDAVAPHICSGVLTTPGGGLGVTATANSGTVTCSSFIGHYGSVRLGRYGSSAAAAAAYGEVGEGETVDEIAGGSLRNRVTVEAPLFHTTQDWRWLRGCWIATGHAFDDTSSRFAPQPAAAVSVIAASPLFADLLARCDP
jgi:hypothetical protein